MGSRERPNVDPMTASNDVTTQWLDIPVRAGSAKSTMRGYLAQPAGTGPWPVVLVGFEMFGITEFVRRVAERFASAGYLALVPDFYHWQSPDGRHLELAADADGRTRGFELINGLRRDLVAADARAVFDALARRPDSTGDVAFFGMSAGGHISYYAASQVPLAALVALYPGWLTGKGTGLSQQEPILELTPLMAKLGTPVLLLIGGADFLFGPGEAEQIDTRLSADGVRHELVVYPDTPHGFFCDERDTYRPEAAADAWDRTLQMLGEQFRAQNNPVVS